MWKYQWIIGPNVLKTQADIVINKKCESTKDIEKNIYELKKEVYYIINISLFFDIIKLIIVSFIFLCNKYNRVIYAVICFVFIDVIKNISIYEAEFIGSRNGSFQSVNKEKMRKNEKNEENERNNLKIA